KGDFDITGLVPGGNPIEVSAPGYATRTALGEGVEGGAVEFGIIPLFSRQAVDIQLEFSGVLELSKFLCELTALKTIPNLPFAPSGRLRYESLDPGAYVARVVYPGQGTYQDLAFRLIPGHDLELHIPIAAESLRVRVIPEPGQATSLDATLCVQSDMPGG